MIDFPDSGVISFDSNLAFVSTPRRFIADPTPVLSFNRYSDPLVGSEFASVSGGYTKCGITLTGEVKCWGRGDYGLLGDGTTQHRGLPSTTVPLGGAARSVSVGYTIACALLVDNSVKCWGRINSTTTPATTPQTIAGLSNDVTQVVTSWGDACALATSGEVSCWGGFGLRGTGALGVAGVTQSASAQAVTTLSINVAKLAAGAETFCAILKDKSLSCWGPDITSNTSPRANNKTPTSIDGLSEGVAEVAIGAAHACAIMSNRTVRCWGNNNGFRTERADLPGSTPQVVSTTPESITTVASDPVAIVAMSQNTCLLTQRGSVQCLGTYKHSLGRDDALTEHIPSTMPYAARDVTGLSSGVAAIFALEQQVCAKAVSGRLVCWGYVGAEPFGGVEVDVMRTSPASLVTLQTLRVVLPQSLAISAGAAQRIDAASSLGLTLAYETWTPDVCTVRGGAIVTIAQGVCGLRISQAGSSSASAAAWVGTIPVRAADIAGGAHNVPTLRAWALVPVALIMLALAHGRLHGRKTRSAHPIRTYGANNSRHTPAP